MKRTLIGLSIIAAFASALASAESHYVHATVQVDNPKNGYIGGSLGSTKLDVSSEEQTLRESEGGAFNDTDTGFKLFVGFRFHENFAAEVFYADLGKLLLEISDLRYTSSTYGVSVLGILPVAEHYELFGKVGFHETDTVGDSEIFTAFNEVGTRNGPLFGIGAAYNINPVSIRAEYELYELDAGEDISMMSVGIAYNF